MGDLFTSLSDAEQYRDLAWVGYYDGEAGLAEGFAEAAEAIFAVWQDGAQSNDRLLLPLAYNYRHALELALKQAIRQAAACRQLDVGHDPALIPQALEAHFRQRQRHRLGPLARQLVELLEALDLDQLPQDAMRLLQDLHQIDPAGEAFRYEGSLETSAHHVDVTQLVGRLRRAFRIIHSGVLNGLTEHANFLHKIREEYAEP